MFKDNGFSLVELMVGIAIVGIIYAMAIPTYQHQIMSSRRADVQNHLLQLQLQQESFRLQNPTYAATADLTLPNNLYYTFAASNISATTYTITATAKVGSSQASDTGCTAISLNQSMDKTPADCW